MSKCAHNRKANHPDQLVFYKMTLRRASAPISLSFPEVPDFKDYLARCDLFCRCSPQLQSRLVKSFHFRHYSRGDVLIEEGQRATTLYVLLKGQVEVVSDRYEAVLAELGPGMIFGEIGAVFGVKRTARVVAKTDGLVAVISRAALKQVLGQDKHIWNQIKGLAAIRYRSMHRTAEVQVQLSAEEKQQALASSHALSQLPNEVLQNLALLSEAHAFDAEEIVEFFSGRTRHLLYIVKEGQVELNAEEATVIKAGDSFVNYDEKIDFAKALTDKTILIALEVELAAPLLAEDIANQIFKTSNLTRHIDANSSFTAAIAHHGPADLAAVVNPAQFSTKRRNSEPVFLDSAMVNNPEVEIEREAVADAVLKAETIDTDTDEELKVLLLNAGIVVPETSTLLHDGRLNLNPIKNELSDGLLIAIVTLLGSELSSLNLADCHRLTSRGVLAVWLHCPQLVRVSLQGCWNLDNLALSTLSRSKCAATLKELDLSHCARFTPKVLEDLGAAGMQLTKLNLSYCKGFNDLTLPVLSQFADSLRHLQMRRCLGVTDASFEAVFGLKFPELRFVDLSENPFLTDASITCLLNLAPNASNLNLSFCTGLKGVFLIHHASLPKLLHLNLSHVSEIDGSICSRLGQVCGQLEELHLDGCGKIDDDSVRSLMNDLIKLRRFSVNSCPQVDQNTVDLISLQYEQ